jgi:hypothetical protein
MHLLSKLTFSLLSLIALAGAAQASQCPVVTPGVGIGPVKLGMTNAQVHKLGVPITQSTHEVNIRVAGLEVWFTDGRVSQIAADSANAGCAVVHGQTIDLKKAPLEAMAAIRPGTCGPLDIRTGGNAIECESGLAFYQHMAGKEVRVAAALPAPKTRCDAYVAPGAEGDKRVGSVAVKPGETVCFQGRTFTGDLTPPDVESIHGMRHINTCEKQVNRGATVLTCRYSGVRLIFGGPTLRLARMEAVPVKAPSR